jgi:CheY-like chemotaxis protein
MKSPLIDAIMRRTRPNPRPSPPGFSSGSGKLAQPAPILVLEDEALIMMMALDILEEEGFTAFLASDAVEAAQVLKEHPDISLLFTDIDLPGPMDGLTFASPVCLERPDIEVIVTSGKHRLAGSDLPDHGPFIAKPCTADELIGDIEQKLS